MISGHFISNLIQQIGQKVIKVMGFEMRQSAELARTWCHLVNSCDFSKSVEKFNLCLFCDGKKCMHGESRAGGTEVGQESR